jgi:ISXO2 transposase-like protein
MVERGGKVAPTSSHERAPPRVSAATSTPRRPSTRTTYRNFCSAHPDHHTIRHTDRIYASDAVHTQTVEGFFGNVKNGIAGNFKGASPTWLQSYLNEYT